MIIGCFWVLMAIPDSSLPGHKRLDDRVRAALDRCQESMSVDFKESCPWEQLKYHVVKNVLAWAIYEKGEWLSLVHRRGTPTGI